MKTVLVTGAAGFIGAHLCRRLLQSGHRVVALVRPHTHRVQEGPGLSVVTGDVSDSDCLLAAAGDHGPLDAIVHLATEPPGDGPRQGTNEAGTAAVIHCAQATGVARVVFTSTMSVFDFSAPDLPLPLVEDAPVAPGDAYGREKLAAEMLCRQAHGADGRQVITLRLAGVYGPGKASGAVYNFLRAAAIGRPIEISLDRAVDLLWVEDAVWALVQGLQKDDLPELLHVGSGQALRLSDLAHAAWRTAAPAGLPPKITAGAQGNAFVLDITRARRHLGFVPSRLDSALQTFSASLTQDTEVAS